MPRLELSNADPKGLIRESYRIEGITEAECRSIFLDWALSLDPNVAVVRAVSRLVMEYGLADGHPMTVLLYQALAQHKAKPRRRGGAMGRRN